MALSRLSLRTMATFGLVMVLIIGGLCLLERGPAGIIALNQTRWRMGAPSGDPALVAEINRLISPGHAPADSFGAGRARPAGQAVAPRTTSCGTFDGADPAAESAYALDRGTQGLICAGAAVVLRLKHAY